jgi:hypothetical protein
MERRNPGIEKIETEMIGEEGMTTVIIREVVREIGLENGLMRIELIPIKETEVTKRIKQILKRLLRKQVYIYIKF